MGVGAVASGSRPAVFLDRDGVVNDAVVRNGLPYPPANLSELRIASDVPAALAKLQAAGFVLLVVTNQPDVARGTVSLQMVEAINARLRAALLLDGIYMCTHDGAECDCRKPKAGLLLEAARDFNIDLQHSWMIGDRWKDVEAGRRAGVRTVFIDRAYAEDFRTAPPNARVASLSAAADHILNSLALKGRR
jgi:D-glycero-D-manno-heptose 1,7-bisphosphate phosphatase